MGNYLHTLSRAAQDIQQKIIRTHLSLHISQVCDNSREAVWKTQFYVYVEASGSLKLCVSTRISRVPENLWEEMTRTRHLVNDARICGTSFWQDMMRASNFSKFCQIFKILTNFQNDDSFSKC